MRVRTLASLLLMLCSACSELTAPATQLIVVVQSDLELDTALTRVRVELRRLGSDDSLEDRSFSLRPDAHGKRPYELPFSFGVVKPDRGETRFVLVVTGSGPFGKDGAEITVVQQKAIASFQDRRAMQLNMFLAAVCGGKFCESSGDGDWTCYPEAEDGVERGECGPVKERQLSEVKPGRELADLPQLPEPVDMSDSDATTYVPDAQTPQDDAATEDMDASASGGADATVPCEAGEACPDTSVDPMVDTAVDATPDEPRPECTQASECEAFVASLKPAGCAAAACVAQRCVLTAIDADKDGHATNSCSSTLVQVVLGDDCNDTVKAIHPGAKDTCEAGNDSNCNAVANEECPCLTGNMRECGTDTGNCQKGKQTCQNGVWPADCPGSIPPQKEDSCVRGDDADCDGKQNENCPCLIGEKTDCAKQFMSKGVCGARPITCVAPGVWPSGTCAPSSVEMCFNDGSDEDCDGEVNECCTCVSNQTRNCGACGNGVQACSAGACGSTAWGACNGATSPVLYYRDADGDGRCNRSISSSLCSMTAGYVTSSCSLDCFDGNVYVWSFCGDIEIRGPSYGKGCCGGPEDRAFNFDCGLGWHSVNCYTVRESGGSNGFWITSWSSGVQAGECVVHYSLQGLEGVAGYGVVVCRPDGL